MQAGERDAQMQRQLRGPMFDVMQRQFGGDPQPQPQPGMLPPPPQDPQMAPAPPPGTLSPGGGNQQAAPGSQQPPQQIPPPLSAGAGPSAAPPMIPPFRQMPTERAPMGASAAGEVPSPPMSGGGGAAGAMPSAPAAPEGPSMAPIIQSINAMPMPSDQKMMMLQGILPFVQGQQKMELAAAKAQIGALEAGRRAMRDYIQSDLSQQRADIARGAEVRRMLQGDERLDISQQRADIAGARLDIAGQRENRLGAAPNARLQLGGPMGLSQDALDNGAAFLILNGRLPMGLSRQGPEAMQAIQNRAAEMTKKAGLTPEEFAAAGPLTRQKLGAYLQLEKNRNAIQAYEAMLGLNIDILKELSGKVSRTGSPYVNRPVLWLQQNATGDADVAEYLFQVQTVSTEIARVLNNPNLTGQLTDTARKELQSVVRGELNPQQMDRVLARAKVDASNRSKSFDTQADKLIKEIKDPLHRSDAEPAPSPTIGRPSAPQEALDYLKAHPETAAQFSAKYGYLPAGARRAP